MVPSLPNYPTDTPPVPGTEPLPGMPPPVPPLETLRRRPDAEDAKANQLGLQRATATTNASNQRRSWLAAKFFAASIVIMVIGFGSFAAMLYSFYQNEIVPQLARAQSVTQQRHELESVPQLASAQADLAAAQAALTKANDAILRLQRQYDALALKQQATESNFASLVDQMKKAMDEKPSGNGKISDTSSSLSYALQVASMVPATSPVNQELILLKERNRLTFWADEAIATGSSEAMDNLWRSLDDPEIARLRDGVKAEIIRVQNYYSQLSRLPPDYRIPVQAIYQDPTIRSEADLQPAQLVKLLLDHDRPVEVRARAAYVLGSYPKDPQAVSALVQAMTSDPSLDVIKEAQRNLSEQQGMIIPPLNARAAAAWWKEKNGK